MLNSFAGGAALWSFECQSPLSLSPHSITHTTLACTAAASQRADCSARWTHSRGHAQENVSLILSASSEQEQNVYKRGAIWKIRRATDCAAQKSASHRSVASIERVQVKQLSISSKYALNRGKKPQPTLFLRRRTNKARRFSCCWRERIFLVICFAFLGNKKRRATAACRVSNRDISAAQQQRTQSSSWWWNFLCLCRRNCFN